MAKHDRTEDWGNRLPPDDDMIKSLALTAYAHLPQKLRTLTTNVTIHVTDYPSEDIADDLGLETPFDLLGLYEGQGEAKLWTPRAKQNPNRLTLYRRAILDYWAENEEPLGEIIAHIVTSELGHHFGLSEDEIAQIENQAL